MHYEKKISEQVLKRNLSAANKVLWLNFYKKNN